MQTAAPGAQSAGDAGHVDAADGGGGRPQRGGLHPTQGSSFPEPGRLEFVAARPGEELRDASLSLRGLRAEDEANYTCRFAMFPDGSKSARTWLRVLGEPRSREGMMGGYLISKEYK